MFRWTDECTTSRSRPRIVFDAHCFDANCFDANCFDANCFDAHCFDAHCFDAHCRGRLKIPRQGLSVNEPHQFLLLSPTEIFLEHHANGFAIRPAGPAQLP